MLKVGFTLTMWNINNLGGTRDYIDTEFYINYVEYKW